ncbi:SpoIIE family protein phosphatase [Pleionea sp. CnH1-48]|uniref:SpoIIE family protein phosphatase n=1 Tax=Pleionea sp. CnH1-48 TaxID=2954494 RepID=UPI0020985783|nr:SpoIIE family protein phosphatase [Pleionea sp. CnH1-48]MCO7227023.1 SpoIIE family protein phosphatase [Pleionea sp. CnH1-48]
MSKLFQKTFLLLTLAYLAVTSVASGYSGYTLYQSLLEEYRSKGSAIAMSLADSSVDMILFRDAAVVQSTIEQYMDIKGVNYVYIVNHDNRIIAHTFIPVIPPSIKHSLHNNSLLREAQISTITLENGQRQLDVAVPILLGKVGQVHVGMDLALIENHVMKDVLAESTFILLIFIIGTIFAYFFVQRVSKPLVMLNTFAENLAEHNFEGPLHAQNNKINSILKQNDEVGNLTNSFVELENKLVKYIANYKRTTAEKESIESELKVAKSIQMAMIQATRIDRLNMNGVEVGSYMKPAKDVGGDFYDVIPLNDNLVFFVIGDVSGKGVPAALYMAVTMTLCQSFSHEDMSALEIIEKTNNHLMRYSKYHMFVTLILGILDTRTGEMTFASAGHNPPVLVNSETGTSEFVSGDTGIALGVIENTQIKPTTLTLKPGDMFLAYTDGITEAFDSNGECYGEERFLSQCLKAQTPKKLVAEIIIDVKDFSSGIEQSDDLTVLCMKYK